jgi:membrane-associated phospholipid phosphatase
VKEEGAMRGARRRAGLPVLVGAHLAATARTMGLRGEHLAADGLLLALWAAGPRGRRLARIALPFWVTGVLYDNFRHLDGYRRPVRVAGPYELELKLFGVDTPAGRKTPAAVLQERPRPSLDLACGLAYLTYLFQPLVLAGWWGLRGEEQRARRLAWGFLAVNVAGMLTHLFFPVAPPWYVARYGLAAPKGHVPAEPAGAARFDDLVGVNYFRSFYARSPDVFGAMPSLHAAYPALCVGAAASLGGGWTAGCAAFAALVGYAAVYLGHHYVIDVIAGYAYGAAAWMAVAPRRSR